MSSRWNPMSFTVAQFGERLDVSYDAALHLLSSLVEKGHVTQVGTAPRKRLNGKGAVLWRLHSRPVKTRTPLLLDVPAAEKLRIE